MPQMAPMMWLYLYIFMFIVFILFITFIYFLKPSSVKMKNEMLHPNQALIWKW